MPMLSRQKITEYTDNYLNDLSMETGDSRASIVRRALFDAAYSYNNEKEGMDPFYMVNEQEKPEG
jgi:hypothetical protein